MKCISKLFEETPPYSAGHSKMHRKVLNLLFRTSVIDKNRISNFVFFLNEARFTESRNLVRRNNRCGCQENPRAVNDVSLT
jgi:hypothetical protein